MTQCSSGRWILLACLLAAARVHGEEIAVSGGAINVQFSSRPSAALETASKKWIQNAALAIWTYYGAFPIRRGVLHITVADGRDVSDGHAFGDDGPSIAVSIGRDATKADFAGDWILTHEMLHLCFPDLNERHLWMEEGLATYVEPVARARAGLLTPERVWGDLVRDLPQGLPEKGDRGLDNTHTWARTYWGGALFCLRADIEMRRRTNNRHGLEHALRAIAEAGGTIEHAWKIERVIATGDTAVGAPVLRELYDEMKEKPVAVDLPALWKQLGVISRDGNVSFDDNAPLAAVRRAITSK